MFSFVLILTGPPGLLLPRLRLHVVDHADHLVAHIIPHHLLRWPPTLQSMPIKLDLPNKLFPLGIKDDGHAGLLQLHSGEKNIETFQASLYLPLCLSLIHMQVMQVNL